MDIKEILDKAIEKISKEYGKGAIVKLGDKPQTEIEVVSSGSISLDLALGVGGFPKGKIIEVFGPESSGKTTLMLHAIAETQKAGGVTVFIDVEHAFDPEYAKNLGVDIDNLYFSQPNSAEEGLEIMNTMISAGVSLIVIDSVAALVPVTELEGQVGDAKMGVLLVSWDNQ